MKIALVYDRLNKLGGAEVILQAFHELFPHADWYTSVWDPTLTPFTRSWRVRDSWLSRLPYLRRHHELVPFLMPSVFESFNFDHYDLVISIGSAEVKGIITKPGTTHLHYSLTPTRYLWSHRQEYLSRPQFGLLQRLFTPAISYILNKLAQWDLVAATRPDVMISISKHVKKRIKKYYNRDAPVIYPPLDLSLHTTPSTFTPPHQDYFLTVSRLVPYKRLDLLVDTFNQCPAKKFIIVGTGSQLHKLKQRASSNIYFTGHVSHEQLMGYYQHARAFLQANVEDFGLAMTEALAHGKPIIAFNQGGASEIVQDGTNGILVKHQTTEAFLQALDKFETINLQANMCRDSVRRFSLKNWKTQLKQLINTL